MSAFTKWEEAAQQAKNHEVSKNNVDPEIRRAAYIGMTWFTRTFPERYWSAKECFGSYLPPIAGIPAFKSLTRMFEWEIKWFAGAPAQLIGGSGARGDWDIWLAAHITSKEFAAEAAAHECWHAAFGGFDDEANAALAGRAAARYYRDSSEFKFVLGGVDSVDAKRAVVTPGSYLLTFENSNDLQCYRDARTSKYAGPNWRPVTLG